MQAFPPTLRWSGALAVVLALHVAVVSMLLARGLPPMAMPAAPDAVLLDLAPDLPPVQPAAVVPPVPAALPPPPMPVPETPPDAPIPVAEPPPVELPPMPPMEAEAVLPIPPPPPPRPHPRPKPRHVERPPVERQSTPQMVDQTPRPMAPAPVQAAPVQPTPSWRTDLLARLQRAKRYPDLARSHGDQGVATVTFTIDRGGRVLSVNLVRNSGSASLDDEAVALVHRAEPLPRLPEEMPGSTITLTVPISFALR